MATALPFNFKKWIDENRDKLKPPVGNAQVYHQTKDFIIMVVGGPNSRKDFHYNESEEFFYQLEGDINVKIFEEGKIKNIEIKEGEIFLLPAKIPHSPIRGENTVGLVVEKFRQTEDVDGFIWFCENCEHKLYEEYFKLVDIVTQFPPIMERFYNNVNLRTCVNCGEILEPPIKL
jgi:3-hydroxyanthranilate 3,4-dioxygenase